jgi:hypothetical protein
MERIRGKRRSPSCSEGVDVPLMNHAVSEPADSGRLPRLRPGNERRGEE